MGFYRRLSYSQPSPTLVTSPVQKATMMCHPTQDRPLSIQAVSYTHLDVYKRQHLAGKAVFASSANLLIPHLHRFPTGGAVDNAMEQVVEGAGISFHNRWPAIYDCLYLFPFLRCHNRFMTTLNDFPVLTGNDVIGVGRKRILSSRRSHPFR